MNPPKVYDLPLSPVGADRVVERLARVEAATAANTAKMADVVMTQEVTTGRLTLLVQEVVKLKNSVTFRASLGSALGAGVVQLLAKLFG